MPSQPKSQETLRVHNASKWLWLSAHDHPLSSKTWRGFSQEATAPAQRFSPPPLAPVRGQRGSTYQSRRGHVPARPRPRPQRPPAPGSPAVTEPPWEQLGSDSGAPLRREAAETREPASKRCQCSSPIGPSLHKPPEPSSLRSFKLATHAQSCPRNSTGSKPLWARPSPFSLTVPPFSAQLSFRPQLRQPSFPPHGEGCWSSTWASAWRTRFWELSLPFEHSVKLLNGYL